MGCGTPTWLEAALRACTRSGENGYCKTIISALGDETLTCNLSGGGGVSLNPSDLPLTVKLPRCQENQAAEKIRSLSGGKSVGGRGAINPEVEHGCNLTTMVKGMKTGLT